MKRILMTLGIALLAVLAGGQVFAQANVPIRVEATPELAPGYILFGQDFTLDFYMTQNSGATCLGFSSTYELSSPDGSVTNIVHRNIGGNAAQIADGSIKLLNGFQQPAQFGDSVFWNAANTFKLNSWDGILPDTFNHTTIALPLMPPMPGWPSEGIEKLHMQVGLTISDYGTFCIDSVDHANNTYDWLWSPPQYPSFNGPYCWDIVDEVPPDNQPPEVGDIPNQSINEGATFATIALDDYVSDPDDTDDEMTWTFSGNTDLTVTITDRVATIGIPDAEWSGAETITFRATDPGALYDEDAATFTVTAVNDAPVVADIPDQTIAEGASFATIALDDYVSDVDNDDDEMTWTYSGNSDLTVTITARVATIGIPGGWSGAEMITFRATDPGALYDEDAATFTVTAVNDAPEVSDIPDQTIAEGASFATIALDDFVADPDNTDDELTWTFSGNTDLTVTITDRVATIGLPSAEWSGAETITFRATDPGALFDEDAATFTVTAVNDAPVVADIPDQTIAEGDVFNTIMLDNFVSDVDNTDEEIIWTYSGNSDLSVTIFGRVATIIIPNPNWYGFETITFRATDPDGLYAEDAATFTVTAINDAPVVSDIPGQTIGEGGMFAAITLDNYVSDVDNADDEISWTYSGNSELTVTIVDRVATIAMPSPDWSGSETITFRATDPGDLFDEDAATFTVSSDNDPPVVSDIPDQTIAEGESFAAILLKEYVTDPDNAYGELIWTYSGNTELIVEIIDTIAVITISDEEWNGFETITFRATDPGGLFDEDAATFTVTAVNDAPVVSNIPNQVINQGESFTMFALDDYVTDVDNPDEDMTWTYSGNTDLIVDITDRVVAVTVPNAEWYGAETITFRATDPDGGYDEDAATFTVNQVTTYTLQVSPISYGVTYVTGITYSDSLEVSEVGGAEIEFTYSQTGDLVQLPVVGDPISTPSVLHFSILPITTPGVYYDTIVIVSNMAGNSPLYVPVTVTIEEPQEYELAVDPVLFVDTLYVGDSAILALDITEVGGASVPISYENLEDWLWYIPPMGTEETPFTLNFMITAVGLTPATYLDTIVVTSPSVTNSPVKVPVMLVVEERPINPGDNCDSPIRIAIPGDLPYLDHNQTTCGRGNDYHETCLGYYDGGEDIVYEITVTQDIMVSFMLDPGATGYSGILLDDACPSDGECVALSTNVNHTPHGMYNVTLTVGTYYLMVDTWPSPDCIPDFDLAITESLVPGGTDSVWVSRGVPGPTGSNIIVPVYFKNETELAGINLPLTWNSDGMELTEVTFDGTRVEDVDNKPVVIDNASRRVQISVVPTFTGPIDAGRGPLALLHFAIDEDAVPGVVTIATTEIAPAGGLAFLDTEYNVIIPTFIDGEVIISDVTGFVCGRVIDIYGNEIEGATVEFWNGFPDGWLFSSHTTDINGEFACENESIFPFDAYAYKEGYYPNVKYDVEYGDIGFEIVLTPVEQPIGSPYWIVFACDDNWYFNAKLPVGSVIDAYDEDGTLCGNAYVSEAGKYRMNIYKDEITTLEDEGALPGDTIDIYVNGYPARVTTNNNIWPISADNGDIFIVCLDLESTEDRRIDLAADWNLISWNVDTPVDDIEMIFSQIMDSVDVILGFERGGFTYDPQLPQFSNLWHVDHYHGYWVKMKHAMTLTVTGVPVSVATPIMLESGWNLVSYLPNGVDTVPHALASVHDHLIVALGWNGGPQTYDPAVADFYWTLTHMGPGFGYWLKITTDDILEYPGGGSSVLALQTLAKLDAALELNPVVPTCSWMNIYSHELLLNGSPVPEGTEVVVKSASGRVVGAGTVETGGKFGFVAVYGDDPLTDAKDGLVSGESYTLEVGGVATEEMFEWTANGESNEILALTTSEGSPILPDNFDLSQNYPNPFNPSTQISFTVPRAMSVSLEVYNVLGKKVATVFDGMADAGRTVVTWDGRNDDGSTVASGIYFYRIKADDFVKTRKMVLMK
ncbi:MAG: T9SS type A sorting domain-containing protein [candidate division Zixibacteria bacterium]|nr:T9SS type A sorting domain-containing protein [candidate division Zixibacteria bacterium]